MKRSAMLRGIKQNAEKNDMQNGHSNQGVPSPKRKFISKEQNLEKREKKKKVLKKAKERIASQGG